MRVFKNDKFFGAAVLIIGILVIILSVGGGAQDSEPFHTLFELTDGINLRGNIDKALTLFGAIIAILGALYTWTPAKITKVLPPLEQRLVLEDLRRIKRAIAKPSVKLGSEGHEVIEVQKALKAKGYEVEINGIYDKELETIVSDFQARNNLKVDGIVGDETRFKLGILIISVESSRGPDREES